MTRFILTMGCCLVLFALVADTAVSAESKPAAEKSEEKKPEAAKEKPEAATEKPDAEAKKSDAAAEKSKPAVKKTPSTAAKPEKKDESKEDAEKKPETHTVKAELVKTTVSLKGNFESQSASEIVLRPKAWASFKVLEAVEHGAEVERDDVLVEFESKDIDEAIADQRRKIELSSLAIKQAEEGLKMLEETTPLDLASADRSKRYSDEDLAQYFKIDRPMSEKIANFNVETSENYLKYEEEELRQLEKMYEADDLTEETEEIILQRQRDSVKRAAFYLETDRRYRDEMLKSTLPRRDVSIKDSTQRAGLSLNQTKVLLPLTLGRSRLDLEKLKVTHAKEEEKLEKLMADRDLIVVKAPTAGVVYYGRFNRGEWGGASALVDKLRPKGSVTANAVFMTIVKPRPLVIRLKVPEKNFHELRSGLRGTVTPTGFPEMRIPATVSKIGAVPFTAGNFEARLRVNLGDDAEAIVPGMSCTVKFIPYLKKRALTVPASAVHTDELDDQKHYVMLVDENGKQRKHGVTTGKKSGDKLEIVDGLVAGDKVLKEFPKDEK